MILLTLAAGLGTRAQSGEYIPKALIQVKDKPLVYWSIDSIHPLRTSGLIPNEKIFVGVRAFDSKTFNFEAQIKNYVNTQIQICELQDLTNGPAESAYLIIQSLIKSGEINPEESILINDCDHHYNGNRLLIAARNLQENQESSVLLCTTSKNPLDLSWSFVREEFGIVTGVVEKPANHGDGQINFAEGLIGTYGFSKVSDFMYLYEQAVNKNGNCEFFISRVIDEGITSKYIKKTDKVFIDNFTSLGTAELIKRAISDNSLGGEFKESGTIFLDLDGTIFKHDNGGGIGEFIYSTTPVLVSEGIPQWLQSVKSYGYSIIITSARHESSRELVKDQLAAFKIPHDELILGLSGGPRFIFNDTKDSLACFPTAYVFNYPRNEFPLSKAGTTLSRVSELSIHDEFFGESGERTFLLKDKDNFIVRKQSQNNDNSRDIIAYQFRWFEVVSEFLPDEVPRLKSTNIFTNDELKYFDTEYIPDLVPFGEHLQILDPTHQMNKLEELIGILTKLYEQFYRPSSENFSHFSQVIELKSLVGIRKGFQLLDISLEIPISAYVNRVSISDAWLNISRVLDKDNKFIRNLLKMEKDITTLIHGDPTLSNITTNLSGDIFLLDPIGARVLPSFSTKSQNLGKAHPAFDFSRINLSIEHEYERWANDIVIAMDKSEVDYSLYTNFSKVSLKTQLDEIWPSDFRPENDALTDLVYITTLARIFPYKAKGKRKEAFYLLGILNNKCKLFIEKYL